MNLRCRPGAADAVEAERALAALSGDGESSLGDVIDALRSLYRLWESRATRAHGYDRASVTLAGTTAQLVMGRGPKKGFMLENSPGTGAGATCYLSLVRGLRPVAPSGSDPGLFTLSLAVGERFISYDDFDGEVWVIWGSAPGGGAALLASVTEQ